jgi:hypothetical protein
VLRQLRTDQSEKIYLTNATTASMNGSAPTQLTRVKKTVLTAATSQRIYQQEKHRFRGQIRFSSIGSWTSRRAIRLETVRESTETSKEIAVEGGEGIKS